MNTRYSSPCSVTCPPVLSPKLIPGYGRGVCIPEIFPFCPVQTCPDSETVLMHTKYARRLSMQECICEVVLSSLVGYKLHHTLINLDLEKHQNIVSFLKNTICLWSKHTCAFANNFHKRQGVFSHIIFHFLFPEPCCRRYVSFFATSPTGCWINCHYLIAACPLQSSERQQSCHSNCHCHCFRS